MIKEGKVEVISSKGCSRLFLSSSLMPSLRNFEPHSMSPAVSSTSSFRSSITSPFSGLVICVTGLSKEARKQVMEATERLGGQYSPNLHPQCTHLVVQSFGGRKFEHALKHGSKNGLFIVTLGWFVDSVRRNVRLSESQYSVKSLGENGLRVDDLNRLVGVSASESSCLPVSINDGKQLDMTEVSHKWAFGKTSSRSPESTLSGCTFYIDSDISNELRNKIYEAASRVGATILDQWFVGCSVSHIVCEGASAQKYIGRCNNIVTPLWVLKTTKEKHLQRLVHMSADLASQVGLMLEDFENENSGEDMHGGDGSQYSRNLRGNLDLEERKKIVISAKSGVRNRRGRRMQTCQTPVRPITPSSLLDSICWSISEPTSAACIYTDSLSSETASEHHTPLFFDAKGAIKDSETSFVNLTRPLSESEKAELIFKDPFLTILFPIDRFSEMGPSSRTFFSENGFTCLQVLDHVYAFYQENMSAAEIEVAIHTDSRHADRLRSVYSKETEKVGYLCFRRIDFLGSRKSFEMLKRVSGDNKSNVYELLIRA